MKTLSYQRTSSFVFVFAMALAGMACSEFLPSQSGDGCPNTCIADETMIIGCDNRVVKPESLDGTTEEPWNFIGRFDGGSKCSGTLIADRYVLTAAHCMVSQGDAQLGFALAQEVQHVSQRPFGTYGVSRVFVPEPFQGNNTESDRAYDYAIAELREPIEGATPAQWGYVGWEILGTKPVFTAGYPATPPDDGILGRPWVTGDAGGNYHAVQPFEWLNGGESGLLYTDLDGTGGQSGSAVYSFLTPSQHNGPGIIRKVTGVLLGSPVAACMQNQNWVARLTPGAVEHIENAMAFPGTIDPFWEVIDIPASPTSGQGDPWP